MGRWISWERREVWRKYNAWEWPKISFEGFYSKYRKNKDGDWYSMITPHELQNLKPIRTWKYKAELEWYDEYEWEKPPAGKFRGRLSRWLPKEVAILVWEAWEENRKERVEAWRVKMVEKNKEKKWWYIRQPKRHKPIEDTYNPDDYRMDITLPKEEAMVFRRAFYRELDRLEDEINNVDNKEIKAKLEFDYEFVEAQLALFNSYNK